MKSGIWTALALACSTAGLAGCGGSKPAPPAATPASSLSVSNARLVLSAVKGNPAAAYFDIANNSAQDWTIHDASLKGAQMTMLHTVGGPNNKGGMGEVLQVPVKHGETLHFEPGKLHVMVMDPPATLARGDKSELTLGFPGGDTMTFPLDVRGAGDAR